jgi:threonine dehydratase
MGEEMSRTHRELGLDTIADGLRTSLGKHNWPIIAQHVDKVCVVDEPDIIQGMTMPGRL